MTELSHRRSSTTSVYHQSKDKAEYYNQGSPSYV